MATYAIGDLQGCLDPLQRLLDALSFDPQADRLWFVGDLVNRGPQSLATLRYIRSLGDAAVSVLGNHDLHLLAVLAGTRKVSTKDTLTDILVASDRDELAHWLRTRPLAWHDPALNFLMTHAGVPPEWDLQTTLSLSAEISAAIQSEDCAELLGRMYGNKPSRWKRKLQGIDRLRYAINALTRMRYIDEHGHLDFSCNGPPAAAPANLSPWFSVAGRQLIDTNIVFGHWSSLGNKRTARVYPLDFGCVWGGALAAMDLETRVVTKVFCS